MTCNDWKGRRLEAGKGQIDAEKRAILGFSQ